MGMVSIRVPATSANVGPGFDALGLAVTLYNTLHIDEYDGVVVRPLDGAAVPLDDNNLVVQTVRALYEECGRPFKGLWLEQVNNIPMARGLGSSSACIVGGLLGANRLLGDPFSREQLLDRAARMEGHPDNVAPAFLGGFVTAVFDGVHVYSVTQKLKDDLDFVAIVPDFELETPVARRALPDAVPHRDGVFNVARAALMAASLVTGRYENLSAAACDRLHQPYRLELIPGGRQAMDLCQSLGAYCSYISGAGSTIMAVCPAADGGFAGRMRRELASLGLGGWQVLRLKADNMGAVIEPSWPEEPKNDTEEGR